MGSPTTSPAEPLAPPTDGGAEEAPPAGPRRRRALAAAAVLLVAAAVVAVVLATSGPSKRATSNTGVPPGQTTATVTRRTLTESATLDGTLGYGSTLELYNRLSGTFTWLPAVGAVIGRGGTLYRIDDEPVVLMYGPLPAYRTLKEGVGDGPDVRELNRNLIDLGYDPYGAIGELDHFGEATAAAVRRFQKAKGLPETGEVQLGRVIFAPSARRVTTVHVKLGQDPPPSGSETPAEGPGEGSEQPAGGKGPGNGSPSEGEPGDGSSGKGKSGKDKGKPSKGKSGQGKSGKGKPGEGKAGKGRPGKGKAGKGKPAAAAATEESAGKRPRGEEPTGSEAGNGKGEPGGAGAPEAVLGTTSTQQIVTLKVKAEQQQLARVGESAPVTLPSGRTVRGRITDVGTVASAGESENGGPGGERGGGGGGGGGEGGESATITVTLALAHRVARLDQAPVSVELVKSVRRDVLAVPATALTATAGGGYAIDVLEQGRRVELPVTPGMFADGYVQVEGGGVREGLTVVESE